MSFLVWDSLPRSSVKALLLHLGEVDDPRDPWRVAHPLSEVLLLVVCATVCDCDDCDAIADWGEANLAILRRHLPYHHGVPGGRWLTVLMDRIDPDLSARVFTDWVRATWPERPDLVAIDGKTSRRSHDRAAGAPPLHTVSAFATTARLVLGQEAVPDKASETTVIPILLERLSQGDGLKGAIRKAGADDLLAVKANQPNLLADVESLFAHAPAGLLDTAVDFNKGHGRIEERRVDVVREVDWLDGGRRFPGEMRLPDAACLVRVRSRTELKDRCRFDTRYYVSSATLAAQRAGEAVRGHWAIENSLHWVLDVVFGDDQSRLRKGHGAHTMAIVRHFAINLVRSAPDPVRSAPLKPQRRPAPGATPRPMSLKRRRKMAGWNSTYLSTITAHQTR